MEIATRATLESIRMIVKEKNESPTTSYAKGLIKRLSFCEKIKDLSQDW